MLFIADTDHCCLHWLITNSRKVDGTHCYRLTCNDQFISQIVNRFRTMALLGDFGQNAFPFILYHRDHSLFI